ncbi:uncharacterized protein BDCG_08144 [Blastomyces dermatitidis ER-3]|uniref:Uncharacterized protein n=1 Tax=Ajellomyces dermatitidis (strain ER-3 / ATCC MYA-2586) TaxID=559297 RepID=A0ABP2ENY4_AJEDR|nr:uncharacterized protein BDCG_08144 [Blastomyces dermatitidis ER-3]EEQ84875.2 hypothetical protein BDCG_08144 [Blastomyces dermatitidis ER-3]
MCDNAAAAFMAIKKARLKTVTSMSYRSITFIVTSPPASFAAAAVLLVDVSVFSSSSILSAAVVTLPAPSVNTVAYDSVWSFEEESEESLILGTVTLRSLICSSSPAACLSPAQNTAELSLQNSAVPLSSLCEKASV